MAAKGANLAGFDNPTPAEIAAAERYAGAVAANQQHSDLAPPHAHDPAAPALASASADPNSVNWTQQAQADGTRQSYAKAFLQALGAPLSNGNIALLLSIMQNEGTSARFNPMASTWHAPGAGNFNSVGVKNYADVASAIAAQVTQWRSVFPQITDNLMHDTASAALSSSEWNSYSGNASGSYQAKLTANYQKFSGDPTAGNGLVGTSGSTSGAANATGGAGGGIDPTYTQYQFLMNDPQIGGYLQQLASGSISDATFQSLVQSSNWWKKNSGSARAWQELKNGDPASYDQQMKEYSRQIVEQAQQLGIGLDIGTIDKLANQWGSDNWTAQDLTNALLAYSKAGRETGGLAYGEDQIRSAAASYGVKLNDQQVYQYELGVAKNQQTLNGLTANFAQQAASLYPHLKQQLDQGLTLSQIAQPYISTAASTLEINPDSVDLSNPKWARALAFHDGSQVRQMTNYEWQQTLMQDPQYGYDQTQGGQAAAAALGKGLVGTMTGTSL